MIRHITLKPTFAPGEVLAFNPCKKYDFTGLWLTMRMKVSDVNNLDVYGEIVKSRHPDYPVGKRFSGWYKAWFILPSKD